MVATGYLARLWECVGREPLVDNLWSLSGDAMERGERAAGLQVHRGLD